MCFNSVWFCCFQMTLIIIFCQRKLVRVDRQGKPTTCCCDLVFCHKLIGKITVAYRIHFVCHVYSAF